MFKPSDGLTPLLEWFCKLRENEVYGELAFGVWKRAADHRVYLFCQREFHEIRLRRLG